MLPVWPYCTVLPVWPCSTVLPVSSYLLPAVGCLLPAVRNRMLSAACNLHGTAGALLLHCPTPAWHCSHALLPPSSIPLTAAWAWLQET